MGGGSDDGLWLILHAGGRGTCGSLGLGTAICPWRADQFRQDSALSGPGTAGSQWALESH